jgi:hypothetical protein
MSRAVLMIALLALGACGGEAPTPGETASTPAPAEPAAPVAPPPAATPAPSPGATLPAIDEVAIKASLSPDETFEAVDFEAMGVTTREGTVEGDKAKVWAVPVARGQTLVVTFEPSTSNLYMNVSDAADASGAAIFIGEQAGKKAEILAANDATYLIKPYQPRAMARRGEKGSYKLTIERK